MAKFDPFLLPDENMGKIISEFWKAATLIRDYDEAKAFFKDLLTNKEMTMLARRLQIAKMLTEGFPFEAICLILKVGRGTVAKVSIWLNSGGNGYKIILERLIELEKEKSKRENQIYDPFSWDNIQKRYASYYWPHKAINYLYKELHEYMQSSRKITSVKQNF